MVLQSNVKNSLGILAVKSVTLVQIIVFNVLCFYVDLDEEEGEMRRMEYLLDMAELEKQFRELRERLFYERLEHVDAKLEEIRMERAPEYLNPLATLRENMQNRAQVAEILREFRLTNLEHKNEAEKLAALQHYEVRLSEMLFNFVNFLT